LFLHHIYIEDFRFADEKTTGIIRYDGKEASYKIRFLEFEGFTCVFAC
jgi:4'-phosphopantetheinyl transferase